MKAYRLSVNLKLGLIVFAVLIAVASLVYTDRLVDRLRAREQAIVQLWADAQAQVAQTNQQVGNPYQAELNQLEEALRAWRGGAGGPSLPAEQLREFQEAVAWAQSMPPSDELNFITNEIIIPNPFGIPAIITDSLTGQPSFWRDVPVPDTLSAMSPEEQEEAVERLRELVEEMDEVYQPIPIVFSFDGVDGPGRLVQYVHYDESALVKELRIFPFVQLFFVSLFILVGYLGFSYVRRSEQSSLWVGMAKEAAHQLGTPISSLMGWAQLLRLPDLPEEQRDQALDEIEDDIGRLQRVANRFSDIGSLPKLEPQPLAPLVEETAGYMRRRIPQSRHVALEVDVPNELRAPLNAELFAWVVENLLKNALDAIEGSEGTISVKARPLEDERLALDVSDTGRGIDRRQWKNVFRPGYSTKKRGWGLGLSLAKRIVEQYHGGQLTLLDSRVGEGTTFRIELPVATSRKVRKRRAERVDV